MKRFFRCVIFTVIAVFSLFMTVSQPLDATTLENNGKLIALTFDDGPSDTSAWLLNQLKARNAHVTFFICGDKLAKYGAVTERAVDEGHQVGNHTWDHTDLDSLSKSGFDYEVIKTDRALTAATGQKNFLLRPPHGAYNSDTLQWANRPIITWSDDTYDWAIHSQSDITKRIVRNAKDGAIFLMHETVPTTARGTIDAIDILQKQGYIFVTVDELFTRKGIQLQNGKAYANAPNNGVDYGKKDPSPPFYFDEAELTSYWASPYIAYVEKHKIMTGITSRQFGPEYPMTRAMFATVLARMSGENLDGYPNNFKDIPNNTWYTPAVSWGAAEGLVDGVGGQYFAPNEYLTREEACVMLCRYAKREGITFRGDDPLTYGDSQLIHDWALSAVTVMTAEKIISGRKSHLGTAFDPQKYVSRAEIAAMIARFGTHQ
ncbi:MAG TPA: polysaccharide deacetylase family protein [Clostridiales bacterium]|nr:polysaccharide deacetylase family protein [Clostridiales bacterium]